QEIVLTVSAVDPDGDTVSFSVAEPPADSSIDATTGAFSWTPPTDYVGELFGSDTLTITFEGTDDGNPSETGTVDKTITIQNNEDGDTVVDAEDNCIFEANPAQVDYDGDEIGLACDSMVEIPNRISLWKEPADPSWGRYTEIESRNGTTVMGIFNFDEDSACPEKDNQYPQENGLAIEAPETLVEIFGDLPTDGYEEGATFVSQDGTGWASLSDRLFRVSGGNLTSHHAPIAPNTEMGAWSDDAPGGSTVIRTWSLYLAPPSCAEMGELHSAYHWLGDVETPIFEGKAYIHSYSATDAFYLLAKEDDDTPSLATVNANGITSYPLDATEAYAMNLTGDDSNDYWLCTYNSGTTTSTWQLYRAGLPVESARLIFENVSKCQIYIPGPPSKTLRDVFPMNILTHTSTTSSQWTEDGRLWFVKNVDGTDTEYELSYWSPTAGHNYVETLSSKPTHGYLAGIEFYVFTENDAAYWLNPSGNLKEICADCSEAATKYVSATGTVTWGELLPPLPSINIAARQLYQDGLSDFSFSPTPAGGSAVTSGWAAPNGVVWLNLRHGSSSTGPYELWALDGASLDAKVESIEYSISHLADASGNILIGTYDFVYGVTETNDLDKLAPTDGSSSFSTLYSPVTTADEGYYWIYYKTSATVYSVATWKDGVFNVVRDDLTSAPNDFTDVEGSVYVEYQDGSGWHFATMTGGQITPILSDLEANPRIVTHSVSGEKIGNWLIYTLGGEMWAAPITGGTVGSPVLWSDDEISAPYPYVAFYVHMNPLVGGEDNRHTYCPFSSGGKTCSDTPITNFYPRSSPQEKTPGELAALVEDEGEEVLYLWRNFDSLPPADCCEARAGQSACSSAGISACVCAVDTSCCKTGWAGSCVDIVNSAGCGICI
ncbi:MAG: cadherin repeat domain-containing protein, partial [Proteobacteria bacterium]|nr:cadherin repeat domain-containing protein [Pseudomonadota bacterium]